jgi:urease accessory protein
VSQKSTSSARARFAAADLEGATEGGRAPWKAELSLRFRRSGERTVLVERRHEGPLIVQKPLYPESVEICHAVLVHAPGGIAGGDALSLDVRLEAGARALMTTPAATKWYKSGGLPARQDLRFDIAGGAVFEWLPCEAIVFDQSDVGAASTVILEADAVYAGWEIVCLGRHASGEAFRSGRFRQELDIYRAADRLWGEWAALEGGDRLLTSAVGLRGCHVFGSMVVAAGTVPGAVLDACRRVSPRDGACGVTAPPGIFSARYLGGSAEHAKDYFEGLRNLLRPWYAGYPAQRPRLWST